MARRVGRTGKNTAGKRISVYLPQKSIKIANDIDNLSHFVQLALDQASAIMAFDIIQQKKGLISRQATQEQIDQWNKDHPLDPLTAKRLGKEQWPNTPPSPSKLELW